MARGLTTKQRIFVNEYLVDLNATAAAIRAGYSAKNADKIGPQLLGNSRVAAAIDAAIAARQKRLEVTQDRVIAELAKIAFSDLKDFVEFGRAEVAGEENEEGGPGGPVVTANNYILLKNDKDVDGTVLSEIKQTQTGVVTVKLHDKIKALELLGRHLGMYTDKVEQRGSLTVKFGIPRPAPADNARQAQEGQVGRGGEGGSEEGGDDS